MVSPGIEVFLRIPDGPSDERLHRGHVSGFHGGICTVVLSDASVAPEPGQRVQVHCDRDGVFVRQDAVVKETTHAVVDLRMVGEAVSAERRREPRVSYLHVLQRVVGEPFAIGH